MFEVLLPQAVEKERIFCSMFNYVRSGKRPNVTMFVTLYNINIIKLQNKIVNIKLK